VQLCARVTARRSMHQAPCSLGGTLALMGDAGCGIVQLCARATARRSMHQAPCSPGGTSPSGRCGMWYSAAVCTCNCQAVYASGTMQSRRHSGSSGRCGMWYSAAVCTCNCKAVYAPGTMQSRRHSGPSGRCGFSIALDKQRCGILLPSDRE
jgi:hypothetical protein